MKLLFGTAAAAVLAGSFAAPAQAQDLGREIVRQGGRLLEQGVRSRTDIERERIRADRDMYREDSRLEGRRDDNYTRRYTTDSNMDARDRDSARRYGPVPQQSGIDRSGYGGDGGYSRRGGSAFDRMQGQERNLQSSGEMAPQSQRPAASEKSWIEQQPAAKRQEYLRGTATANSAPLTSGRDFSKCTQVIKYEGKDVLVCPGKNGAPEIIPLESIPAYRPR